MSAIATKFPTTHQELLEIGQGELMRFPATFAEYWELLGKAQYKSPTWKAQRYSPPCTSGQKKARSGSTRIIPVRRIRFWWAGSPLVWAIYRKVAF